MRSSRIAFLGAAALALGGCGESVDPRSLIDDAAAAMGGWEALAEVRSHAVVTTGSDWEPMQAARPGVDDHLVSRFRRTLVVEHATPALRLDFDAERVWPGPAPVRFTEVIEGDVGLVEQPAPGGETSRSRLHPSMLATRLRDANRLPARVLAVARDAPGLRTAGERTVVGRLHRVLEYRDHGLRVELFLDAESALPARVVYTEDDPLLGDTRNELVYSDWRPVEGGLRLPHRMELLVDGTRIREETVESVAINPEIPPDAFRVPEEIRQVEDDAEPIVSQWPLRLAALGFRNASFGRPSSVELEELAPGVVHVRGDGHHSLAVEVDDFLVVVEMPLFEERSLAVIEALEERFPDRPIRYGVVTHYHVDHSGGVRTYAAGGATILAHETSAPFFERVLARPRTVRPDLLAAAGHRGEVEAVSGVRVIAGETRTVELHHVPNPHSDDMLIAYVPEERIVFVSDLHSPGGPVSAENENQAAFYRAVVDAGLDVERVVGGHGGVAPFAELEAVMASGGGPR